MMYETTDSLFTGICDAIRKKDGTTAIINHQDIPERISAISGCNNEREDFTSAFYTKHNAGLRIENMVVSGFSDTASIYTPDAFMPADRPWVIQAKFRLSENSIKSRNFIVGTPADKSNCPFLSIRDDNTAMGAGVPTNDGTTWYQQTAKYDFSVDTDYWVRYIRDKSDYTLLISTNGFDYENIIQFEYADEPYQDTESKLRFGGYGTSSVNTLFGSIDLKETYIKIGDEIWWGKG